LLIPKEIQNNMRKKFRDIWTGSFSTYCRTERNNEIWVFGLNNYHQLGKKFFVYYIMLKFHFMFPFKMLGFECPDLTKPVVGEPTKSTGLLGHHWVQISGGQHHTVALDEDGKVYTFGRSTDGRLGLGEDEIPDAVAAPTLVPDLSLIKCVQVAAGLSTSYALTSDGKLFSWGFGGNNQLGTGNEDNGYEPSMLEFMSVNKVKLDLEDSILYATAGGQHAAVIINRCQ
jgi:regulator of chromosome condensation